MRCNYPNCLECTLNDCIYEYPQKAYKYSEKLEVNKQREYRNRRKKELGIKTEKQRMIEKQDRIYDFILKYTKENLFPPSTVEIQNELGIKGNAEVSRDLHRLEERGFIKIGKGNRAYSLVGYKLVKGSG